MVSYCWLRNSPPQIKVDRITLKHSKSRLPSIDGSRGRYNGCMPGTTGNLANGEAFQSIDTFRGGMSYFIAMPEFAVHSTSPVMEHWRTKRNILLAIAGSRTATRHEKQKCSKPHVPGIQISISGDSGRVIGSAGHLRDNLSRQRPDDSRHILPPIITMT